MAQLLVMLVDKPNPDPYTDCRAYKRGYVVNVYPDDIQLEKFSGIAEKISEGFWTVVKVPDADYRSLSAFTVEEQGDRKVNRMLQRRAFKFDIDTYQRQPKTFDLAGCLAMKLANQPLIDPNVL